VVLVIILFSKILKVLSPCGHGLESPSAVLTLVINHAVFRSVFRLLERNVFNYMVERLLCRAAP
jgi:hypothetical protein